MLVVTIQSLSLAVVLCMEMHVFDFATFASILVAALLGHAKKASCSIEEVYTSLPYCPLKGAEVSVDQFSYSYGA